MSTVGIKELKNRLTHYLNRTQREEEIVVTDRGKPIALIQAIGAARPTADRETRLAQLAALGKILLPTRTPSKRLKPVPYRGSSIGQAVVEDRDRRA